MLPWLDLNLNLVDFLFHNQWLFPDDEVEHGGDGSHEEKGE